jgi:spore coat polysaccharide biosynthesis protein SpsF
VRVNVVTIVQARTGSSRHPGKVLAQVGGWTVLEWVLHRLNLCQQDIGRIVVATTTSPGDDAIVALCHNLKVECFRGPEHDVLDRYHQAALLYQADAIVRVTADCPLLCPRLLDETVRRFRKGADYVGLDDGPPGFGQEILSMRALHQSWKQAKEDADREHVVTYLLNRPEQFKLRWLVAHTDLINHSAWRFTVDEASDLLFLRRLHLVAGRRLFYLPARELIAVAESNPELLELAYAA